MSNLVSIPREALAGLLKASGSALSPEQYLASLATLPPLPQSSPYARFPGRATASSWSKHLLLVAVIIGAVILPFDFTLEALALWIGVAVVTFVEYKVNRYFREQNPKAPTLGFRNQSAFAAAILVYGLYHAVVPYPVEIPQGYREYMDPSMLELIQISEKITYFAIGIAGGASQFGLACYYRFARVKA